MYKKFKRIFVIVLDSLGIGEMDDSASFGDVGVNTLGHILEANDDISMPNLDRLGMRCVLLGERHVDDASGVTSNCYYTALREESNGKDTMTGHWEMMGIKTTKPFKTFTDTGFPDELIKELEKRTGREIIGNKSASGTVILDELAEEEIYKGKLIVYTSADSVLQICGNEETMGLDRLYHYCEIARELTMDPKYLVGRVIARPYTGSKKGEFVRTANRHDYAVKPPKKTVLNQLADAGYDVISVGKIKDIFADEGITKAYKSKSSVHGMEQTIELADEDFTGLCFTNLVDFDALWGHRRNPVGYGQEIEAFDKNLEILLNKLGEEDMLIITADHGNDPTYTGTDHTREKVPFLCYSKSFENGRKLEEQASFGVIGQTIVDNFNIEYVSELNGESLLDMMR